MLYYTIFLQKSKLIKQGCHSGARHSENLVFRAISHYGAHPFGGSFFRKSFVSYVIYFCFLIGYNYGRNLWEVYL